MAKGESEVSFFYSYEEESNTFGGDFTSDVWNYCFLLQMITLLTSNVQLVDKNIRIFQSTIKSHVSIE